MKVRIYLAIAAALAAAVLAGCGGSGGSSGPASLAPPDTPVFVEATVMPEGDLQANVDTVVRKVAGISNAGAGLVALLNQQFDEAGDGDLSYANDIEPWLGSQAGLFARDFNGEDLNGIGLLLESTDDAAAQKFVDHAAESNDSPVRDASYEGVDFKVDKSDGSALGTFDGFVVFGEDVKAFKAAVDASKGDSLAGNQDYESAASDVPDGSLADLYVDAGALLRGSGESIDPQAKRALSAIGADPDQATLMASLVPGADRIELDVSAAAGDQPPSTAGAVELLDSFPADSLAAFAASGLSDEAKALVKQIDRSGVGDTVPQGGLGAGAALAGIDLDQVLDSIADAGLFVTGSNEATLGGALAVSFDNPDVARNVAVSLGRFLRRSATPGVSLLGGDVAGFTIRSRDLGRKPVAVIASGERLAIGYGVPETRRALGGGGFEPLSESASFEKAADALGDTPITGYVDFPGAVKLAAVLGAAGDDGFAKARQFLDKGSYVAIGSGEDGDRATTKIVVGLR